MKDKKDIKNRIDKKASNTLLAILLIISLALILTLAILLQPKEKREERKPNKFSSYEELKSFIKTNTEDYYSGYGIMETGIMTAKSAIPAPLVARESAAAAIDYSTTNIQVEGVDEADIVKSDGKYLYILSGNRNRIVILEAYPAEDAKILSEIELEGASEIFVNKDRLIVFGKSYNKGTNTFIHVYDISDRKNPELKRNVSISGSYFDSRMINEYVYVIVNQPIYFSYGEEQEEVPLPIISDNSEVKAIEATEISYFDFPDYSYRFVTILAINTQNNDEISREVFLMGSAQDMYVSLNNIYITYTKRVRQNYQEKLIDDIILPLVPEIEDEINTIKNSDINEYEKWQNVLQTLSEHFNTLNSDKRTELEEKLQKALLNLQREIAKETEKTVVHKISIKDGKINYKSSGEVPGNVLNQFSMDEHEGFFRIATTTGRLSRIAEQASSQNHIYVLNENLEIIGKLEDLAPGEKIYSARFLGNRAYLVTFRKVDPLFVISLKNPENPKVLGKLKIPGYSDYLHPYDENHLIGIGKETVAAEEGDFSWYQGVKISLFDVSDVENPKELAKHEIGDRGTDSEVLRDHKAFLFSKSKNLIVLPILLAKIDESKYKGEIPPNAYGEQLWQGAYIFEISAEKGISLKGRVGHSKNITDSNRYGYYSPYSVKRSLYIDNVLYTISNKMVKMNSLETLDEINKIELPYNETVYPRFIKI